MIKIGITGSFASGKSELLKHLIGRGYAGFNCDQTVHILHQDPIIQKQILSIFPEIENFDKAKIAQLVYSDSNKRKQLENLMHPLVATKMSEFINDAIGRDVVFLEIPLLFEAKWESACDYIISLYCTRELRQARALKRGINAEMFEAIDKSQIPENTKKDLADFAIDTSCDFVQVASECEKIIQFIV